jgi:pimeloyl-ACP methyl ester carboxylesterase
MHIAPFTIRVPDEVLSDLRTRIRHTRWPHPAPGPAWTSIPSAGHFAAAEDPELLARDIAACFAEI